MITKMQGLPAWVAGFTASGEVTKEDYDKLVLPELERMDKAHGHIHFLLELRTDVGNYTAGAWWKDATAGLKHFRHWKKIAIVSDQKGVQKLTDLASFGIHGETKGFPLSEMDSARQWVSAEN